MTEPAMAAVLQDMVLDEISLVDDPASPGATVALFKRRDTQTVQQTADAVQKVIEDECGDEAAGEFAKAMDAMVGGYEAHAQTFAEIADEHERRSAANEALEGVNRSIWALGDSLRSIWGDDDVEDKGALARESIEQFLAALAAELPAAEADGKQEKRAMTTPAVTTVTKSQMDEAITKAVDAAVAKAKADTEAGFTAEIVKRDTEIAALKEARAAEERLVKAKAMCEGVPGTDPLKLADLLKSASEEGVKTLEATLAAARESHKVAKTFQPIGSDAQAVTKSISEKIDTATDAVLKANPGFSRQKAMDAALLADPSLYGEYKAAHAARN